MSELAYEETRHGVPCVIEPIPEVLDKGSLDPRCEKDVRKAAKIIRRLPKMLLKVNPLKISLAPFKKPFDAIKSISLTSNTLEMISLEVPSFDGYPLEVRIYRKKERRHSLSNVLIYYHGGGFIARSMDVVRDYNEYIAATCDLIVVSVNYRLAPTYAYPTAHKDCKTVATWVDASIETYGGNPKRIFVAGDSAGGHIAIYVARHCLFVKGMILLYPVVDLAKSTPYQFESYSSHRDNVDDLKVMLDFCHQPQGLLSKMTMVLGCQSLDTDDLSPLHINIPTVPLLVMVGEHDFLMLQVMAFCRHMKQLGTFVDVVYYEGMTHGFGDFLGKMPQTKDSVDYIARFIEKIASEICEK